VGCGYEKQREEKYGKSDHDNYDSAGLGGGEGKGFFLEKKEPKTFGPGPSLSGKAAARWTKVFCFFFSKKKTLPT
jgi:hypothetical protein